MSQITPNQLAAVDPVYWAHLNQIVLDGHKYDLQKRAYQHELMRPYYLDSAGNRVVKKMEAIMTGSQVGKTMGKVIECCHGAIHGMYPQGIIVYFPNRDDVSLFSKMRFKPFIDENECVSKHMDSTDTTEARRIGQTPVYFLGASATKRIGGEMVKQSTKTRSIPADWMILDEFDMFDPKMSAQVNQRLGNSTIGRRTDVGTPVLPEEGIHARYLMGDQRAWFIKCDGCGKRTCAEREFPECVHFDKDGTGYLACRHCGRKIVPYMEGSEWVPAYQDRQIASYHVSQLLNPNRNLVELMDQFINPKLYDWTEAEVYRTVLGLPYIEAENKLSTQEVYACCGPDAQMLACREDTAMGVDVGQDEHHFVIGFKLNEKQNQVVRVGRARSWNELFDIATKLHVRFMVIDAGPLKNPQREFIDSSSSWGGYLCQYSDGLEGPPRWNPKTRIVQTPRTAWCDKVHDGIAEQNIVLPRRCGEIEQYASEMVNMAKVLEEDKRRGVQKYRWRAISGRPDHYYHATLYFLLAAARTAPHKKRHDARVASTLTRKCYL